MNKQSSKNLNKFFNPGSIAILGASRDEKKIGHIVLKNIVNSGFRGQIFPINPNATNLDGMDCYANYKDLPEVPDLAILSIPAEAAVANLESIAKKGTKNIIIFSSGFKEIGPQGEKLEKKLAATAEKFNLNILGPNCLGFLNTAAGLNATFSQANGAVGNLRFISQSGALASAIFDWASHGKIGFSEFITLGNKAVINEIDIFRYWLAPKKKPAAFPGLSAYQPVGMYLESVAAGEEFARLVAKISASHPVFILKPGQSKQAQEAIRSHTGSLADDDAVLNAVFKEAGVIRCETLEDMFDLARVFAWENAPAGPNVAIVSNAGGPAVISTDVLEKEGLRLADFSPATRKKLQENLPRTASIVNPVDVLGDALANRYAAAIEAILAEKKVDALVVILTPQIMTEVAVTAKNISALAAKYRKPVFCSFMGGESVASGEEVLNEHKIPSFAFPERAVKALAQMWRWKLKVKDLKYKAKSQTTEKSLSKSAASKISHIIKIAQKENRRILSLDEAGRILNLGGIKTPPSAIVTNLDEAQKFAQAHGWPMVLKISSPDLLHKTEGGGVVLNIDSPAKLKQTWEKISQKIRQLPHKARSGAQIQKQISPGLEVIAGVKYNENFGHVFMFGAGGILVELLKDMNLEFLPLNKQKAVGLIKNSKIYPLLAGYRNQQPYALHKLVDTLIKLSVLSRAVPCKEMEINPIILTDSEAWAADARIILS